MLVEGSVKRYFTDNEGASSNTLATCRGPSALDLTEHEICGLSLIVVVNAVIAWSAITVAFATVEIATHLL